MGRGPGTACWLASGNNPKVSRELARRTVVIKLDANAERPEQRSGFKIKNLLRWGAEHRARPALRCPGALPGLGRRGKPKGQAVLGSFESWAERSVELSTSPAARIPSECELTNTRDITSWGGRPSWRTGGDSIRLAGLDRRPPRDHRARRRRRLPSAVPWARKSGGPRSVSGRGVAAGRGPCLRIMAGRDRSRPLDLRVPALPASVRSASRAHQRTRENARAKPNHTPSRAAPRRAHTESLATTRAQAQPGSDSTRESARAKPNHTPSRAAPPGAHARAGRRRRERNPGAACEEQSTLPF